MKMYMESHRLVQSLKSSAPVHLRGIETLRHISMRYEMYKYVLSKLKDVHDYLQNICKLVNC